MPTYDIPFNPLESFQHVFHVIFLEAAKKKKKYFTENKNKTQYVHKMHFYHQIFCHLKGQQ